MSSRRSRLVLLLALLTSAVLAPTASADSIGPGTRGPAVRHIQRQLAALGFLPWKAVTSSYDDQTYHAVVAFQGWFGMNRDGYAGADTRRKLATAHRPVAWKKYHGARIEVHVDKQVLLEVGKNDRVVRAVHVSTGAGGLTPTGDFKVLYQQTESWSILFKVWLPYASYFDGGYAMHEYPSVPNYPASHGCVRIPESEAPGVYGFAKPNTPVYVHYEDEVVAPKP